MAQFTQLFFISPNGFMPVRTAIQNADGTRMDGVGTHGWVADGDDPHKDQIIGVVEMQSNADPEEVIDRLEAQGIMWLPNHLNNEKIKPEHASALAKHGVTADHTTAQAMTLVHAKSGFPHLKPKGKRF